jgi:CHAT domain-containing protein
LAIQNPTNDRLFTDLEVEILSQYFDTATVLAHESATKSAFYSSENLNYAHCLHLSAHSYFNFANPLESAIILADATTGSNQALEATTRAYSIVDTVPDVPEENRNLDLEKCLTLAEIFELNLNQCRLVTLSACETALTDFNSLSDEYIGFAGAFLYAGSPTVVGSLWTPNDILTAILMIKFYENLRNITRLGTGDVALALNQAQKWLRNLSVEEFEQFLESLKPQLEQVFSSLRKGQRLLFLEVLEQIRHRGSHSFANPYYWAGFIAVGV